MQLLILFYYVAALAGIAILFAGAGLVDLVLLPFRPLMASTYYVGTSEVNAARPAHGTPVRVGHYLIQPPAPGDWYRITALDGAAQSPTADLEDAPYRGARELFVRNPTPRRPSAVRALAGSRMFRSDSTPQSQGQGPHGRTDPAAVLRVDRLEPGGRDTTARLEAYVDATRAGPDPLHRLRESSGQYQEARHDRLSVTTAGLSCIRDELVYLWLADPTKRSTVSKHLAFTLACADPACPEQVVGLIVRGKADSGGELERQGRAFLDGLRVDPTVAPMCGAR